MALNNKNSDMQSLRFRTAFSALTILLMFNSFKSFTISPLHNRNTRNLDLIQPLCKIKACKQNPVTKKETEPTSKSIASRFKTQSINQKKGTIRVPFNRESSFSGGYTAFKEFICNNFKYPQEAIDNKVKRDKATKRKGSIEGYFTIDSRGKVIDLIIYQAISLTYEKEFRRVMAIMPLWKPEIRNHIVKKSKKFPIKIEIFNQSSRLEPNNIYIDTDFRIDEDMQYIPIEKYPEFQGGPTYLTNYLKKATSDFLKTRHVKLYGTVYIQFNVTKRGEIIEVRLLRGIGSPCDDEALRIARKMPNWLPGRQLGEPVEMMFQLGIKFEAPN